MWKKNDVYGVGLVVLEALNLDTASASCQDGQLVVNKPGMPRLKDKALLKALQLSQSTDMNQIPSAEELMTEKL